jgi:probable phosphoglycerate mutase
VTDPQACRIFVVRHGRTALNAQGRYRGRQDPPLDEQGWVDAHWAAGVLAGQPLEAVYTSPLARARQTAEAIGGRHSLVPKEAPELIDLDYGTWEARTPAEAETADPEAFATFRDHPEDAQLPGGEAMRAVADRVLAALRDVVASHPDAPSAAVTHEIPMRLIIGRCLELGAAIWDVLLPPGAILELRPEPGSTAFVLERAVGALLPS